MSIGAQPIKASALPTRTFWRELWIALEAALAKVHVQKKQRVLRIEETLVLGERRFLAIIQFENERLLVGVTPQSITLLEPRHSETQEGRRGFTWEQEHKP